MESWPPGDMWFWGKGGVGEDSYAQSVWDYLNYLNTISKGSTLIKSWIFF